MKKYLILIGLITTLISCEDQLDRTPDDTLISETAYKTVADLADGVNGIYTNYNPNVVIDINEIYTDNARIGKDNGGQKLSILNQILNTQTNSGGIWISSYGTANDCNRIIEAAEIITVEEGEQQQLDNLLAQAYGLRALMHYRVLVYYGEDLTNPEALGVPYQEEVLTGGNLTRLTTQQTVDKITEDLNTANSLLSDGFNDKFSVTKDFVSFVKARLALVTEDWPGVISNTNDLIADYPLANQQQYLDMFAGDTDQTEVIFAYDNVNGYNRSIAGEFIFTGTGGNFIGMARGLYDELVAANDVRFAVNYDTESDFPDEITINKYPSGGGTYVNDFKLMRISEAYLMRAEAYARDGGQFQQAAEAVQAVRNARSGANDTASAYSSLSNAINDIKLERRLELCFEGHRYLDIKRYKNIVNEGINRDSRDCDGNIPCNVPVNDRRWVFPIPQAETNGNADIQQNPEWAN